MKNLWLNSILLFLSTAGHAGSSTVVDRIKTLRFNKAEVQKLYLAPGLGTMLSFPCGIEEAFVGRSEDLKAQVSPNDKKVLFLNLKLNTSLPTNLIVRCNPEKHVFIFDVIPQKSKHQDLVEIKSSFGRPKSEPSSRATSANSKSVRLSPPQLIESAGTR